MKLLMKIGAGLVVVIGGIVVFAMYKNQPPQLAKPDYYEYYVNQDTKPVGRIGVFISHLVMPENYRQDDFYTLAGKSLQYIPWPIRDLVQVDKGLVLLDRDRFYEFEEFTPTDLVDHTGSSVDIDGIPYIDKYENGEMEWMPPSSIHLSHGAFLYPGRKVGEMSSALKLAAKAKNYYYAPGKGFSDGRVPHEAGNRHIVFGAMERLEQTYGDIPWAWVTADNREFARTALFDLLDEGVDTLIIAAPRPVYSHHEEFNGSIKHTMHYLHEWQEARNNHQEIKMIISPELSHFEPMFDVHPAIIRDNLKNIPEGSSVKLVLSVHGMPWDNVPHEGWIKLAPRYVDRSMEEAQKVLGEYNFSRTEIVQSQDHFADPHNNPEGKYLSTNQAFWDGVEAGYDYVLNVPLEFFAENTDTMFYHDMANFENFDDYNVYETVEYTDWSKPYRKMMEQDGTKVIYGGLAAGQFSDPIIDAFYMSLDSIISQGMKPISQPAELTASGQ
jgi:protoheme ferro-lyase